MRLNKSNPVDRPKLQKVNKSMGCYIANKFYHRFAQQVSFQLLFLFLSDTFSCIRYMKRTVTFCNFGVIQK
ncbi:MAG: hypothetical protein CVV42_19800 [Candidatus Riflebacteria bacterium HGW-Riflebacteria-2]|nr:MAG: hypothetical protein CVV42_19800 [Candidatus Riflebacteria bacterium HGW-Riflebacteria-2]